MDEIWKPIEEFEERYLISSLGRVRSLASNKFLSPGKGSHGYFTVELGGKSYLIHRLVAKAFLTNPNGKREVNHINFDRTDNRVDNLEWCTPKENCKHTYKIKGDEIKLKLRNRKRTYKIQPEDYPIIRSLLELGFTQSFIAQKYGASQSTISLINLRKI